MAGFYRTFAGPVAIGVSVWCAMGTVAVLSGAGGTERVVVFAPWWSFVLAAAVAAAVPAWRERPLTALPALFSTLPWWPIPLPSIALLWTGPMAWLPIAAAIVVAEGGRSLEWLRRFITSGTPVRAGRLAGLASLIIAGAAAWAADPRVPGGDEPHYLVITQSLLKDGDLRIENNHASRDYASYFGGTINPDYLARGRDNVIYSIHAPGVSAVVLPAFAVLGFRGAQLTMMLLFAIAGALMWHAAWRLTSDVTAAWFAWAAVAGSTTMAVLSFMVFPETPGACAVAAGVWLMVAHREATGRALVGVSTALAALPWLHTRFSVLAGVLGVALVAMLLTDAAHPRDARWRRAAVFMLVPIVSAAAWLSMFYVMYGTVDPRVPYGPNPEIRSWIWGAVTGLFVDQQFGLLAYAPILSVVVAAPFMAPAGRLRQLSVVSVIALLVYAMAVASYWMWWAGVPGLPARFLTAALPLLSLPIAVAWSRATATSRTILLALLGVSIAITVVVLGVDRAAMAWNDRRTAAGAWLTWLNPVVNLPRSWPSFFWNGERAFLAHAAAMVTVCAIAFVAIRQAARRYSARPGTTRLVVAIGMLAGAMALVQSGWKVTGSAALEPSRAQLALHAAAGAGKAGWRIGPGVSRWDTTAVPLRIHRNQPPVADSPSAVVLSLGNVPAGLYQLDVTGGSLSGGVAISIGRSAFQRVPVTASQSTSWPISLPGGAAVFTVQADSAALARQVQATLVPVSPARPSERYARQYNRFSGGDAFFLDTNVFPEATGFWVRGGRTAEVVLSAESGGSSRPRPLTIRNGGAANTLTIRSGAWQEVLSLAPNELRTVMLPAPDRLGSWPLSFESASGFRPSDKAGEDNRFLGVWVECG